MSIMKKNNEIPKIIHYCWFGHSDLTEDAKKCIASWEKMCPSYKIIQWDESNYDISCNNYIKQAYEKKKWSFVSDYVRLDVVYKYGGIYLDVDVELIKNIDALLKYDAFFGFENNNYVATGLGFGAIPKHRIVKEMLDMYDELRFVNADGSFNLVACPVYNTEIIRKNKFLINGQTQILDNVCILSPEYLAPYNFSSGELNTTDKTYSIHWYNMSWKSIEEKKQILKTQKLYRKNRVLGILMEYVYYSVKYIREKGVLFLFRKIIHKVFKHEN